MSTSTLRITYRIGIRVGRNLRAKVALLHPLCGELRVQSFRDASLQLGYGCWMAGRFDYESTILKWGLLKALDIRVYKSCLSARKVDFAFGAPRHQLLNCVPWRFAFVQYSVHLLGYGHFHA